MSDQQPRTTASRAETSPPVTTEGERVLLFDTSLRDGEQAPGFSMAAGEKVRLARALEALGVDALEAGFPAASPGDFAAVRAVAAAVEGPITAALARCCAADIDRAWGALEPARRPRLHVFIATSPLHRKHKLGATRAEVLERVRLGVGLAAALCADVEFSAEDATRTEPEFLCEVVEAAVDEGASTINLPDTVGYALPHEVEKLFRDARAAAGTAVLSAHCHDDLGLAVANSLAAVRGGARQVECTINGIGERAGNAALEEVAMALRARPESTYHGLDTTKLCSVSRLLAAVTGSKVPPNKAIVGANAFAHEAGIHQHGVLAHRGTYEVVRAEDVGAEPGQIVLGKHSGTHAVVARLGRLGIELGEGQVAVLFREFKGLADSGQEVMDADLMNLVRALPDGCAGDATPSHSVQTPALNWASCARFRA